MRVTRQVMLLPSIPKTRMSHLADLLDTIYTRPNQRNCRKEKGQYRGSNPEAMLVGNRPTLGIDEIISSLADHRKQM